MTTPAWVIVYTGGPAETGVLRDLLEGAGIPATLGDEVMGTMAPYVIAGGWWLGVGRYTTAPDLRQLTRDNAIAEAERQGFSVVIGAPIYSELVPRDTVLQQQPAQCAAP